jgi:hypothetical protein
MGKTGSIKWVRIKNRKGKIRLVPESDSIYTKPGPAQRYTSKGKKRRKIKRSPKSLA